MDIYTGDNGVAGMAHRTWTSHAFAAPQTAVAAPRKRHANAAPTLASVDRSFI
jgi:hypothetical protein